jgi:SET domain-containing protein
MLWKGVLCEIIDDGQYMNHSYSPNCITLGNGDVVALWDIHAGEQLFMDYSQFEYPEWYLKLIEYQPTST